MAEEMVQQKKRPEEEEEHQDRSTEVQEDAAEMSLGYDSPEECDPLQRRCLANQIDEQEEEECPSQDIQKDKEEGEINQASVLGSLEDTRPHPRAKQGQPLEVIVKVVASIYRPESVGQVTDSLRIPRPGSPEELEQESCYLLDSTDLRQDTGSPTGHYPCYHTFSTLCDAEDSPKPPERTDAGDQVADTRLDGACKGDGGQEANRGEEGTHKNPHPLQEESLPPSPKEALARNNEGLKVATAEEHVETPAALPTSHHSLQNLLRWVRNAFRRHHPAPRPERSLAPEGGRRRRPLGSRVSSWIRKHRGRVHPDPS
ncbi:uncharacterized protein LOC143838850 [Paroedura picta]|uniref:uncharacterized protein LOC143838850 n=1 Tax=Paroedura picta TaxID=143630 RepID=UPI0040566BCF